MSDEPNLDLGKEILGSNFGRIGYRIIKGKKVWYRMTKAGHYRKLSEKQVTEILFIDNPYVFWRYK